MFFVYGTNMITESFVISEYVSERITHPQSNTFYPYISTCATDQGMLLDWGKANQLQWLTQSGNEQLLLRMPDIAALLNPKQLNSLVASSLRTEFPAVGEIWTWTLHS